MKTTAIAFGLMFFTLSIGARCATTAPALVEPKVLVVDKGTSRDTAAANELAARRYDTFWNTGDESLERIALSPAFMDRTLPPGRLQGVEGPLQASRTFRKAVPDLSCQIEQMMIVGDHVASHMRCTGHFTGSFNTAQGKGQPVNFIATDIYRVADGKIVEDWHIEDNYTLLSQLGVIH